MTDCHGRWVAQNPPENPDDPPTEGLGPLPEAWKTDREVGRSI